jgi:hypothetical protein
MRYTGGLDELVGPLIENEAGVDAVFITTLEYYEDSAPPKISLHARLVSAGEKPRIIWMDKACMTGYDSMGLLYLGATVNARNLMEEAVLEIVGSLVRHLAGGSLVAEGRTAGKELYPSDVFRSAIFDSKDIFTVAVTPFLNLSERPQAGEILPLHFIERMVKDRRLRILEPGVVRRGLLLKRVTFENGLSLPHLELVTGATEADLVLTGTVFHYMDGKGPTGDPDVDFSVQVFDGPGKKVVWSSRNVNRGSDGVFFFDVGKRRTACDLATGMVQATIEEMLN